PPTSTPNFSVTRTKDPLEQLELRDVVAESRLVLAPKRGGMATRLTLAGKDLFYLDEATLRDEKQNVRGGNPVLFPTPGKLVDDAYDWRGHRGNLKQHGFARTAAWEIGQVSNLTGAFASLRLAANEKTKREFPWDFRAEYKYILRGAALRIEMTFFNSGDEVMPFGAGFHPYFAVPDADKAQASIETTATRAFDNVTKKTGPLEPLDLTQKELDMHLIDHTGDCILRIGDRGVRVRASAEFSRWVVWTLAGKDFVCVEPWTCPGNALNTGDALLLLQPGQSRMLWVEYALI
ncbi:MAG: galactose mutarotase, partial [Polyangiaceae bacterium]